MHEKIGTRYHLVTELSYRLDGSSTVDKHLTGRRGVNPPASARLIGFALTKISYSGMFRARAGHPRNAPNRPIDDASFWPSGLRNPQEFGVL